MRAGRRLASGSWSRNHQPLTDSRNFTGRSVEAAGDEKHSEPVVVDIAEAAGDATVEFDEPIDRFGATVG